MQIKSVQKRNQVRLNGAMVAVFAMMCVAGANRWHHSIPGDTKEFQAEVRATWDEAPKIVGDWVGSDTPLPAAAIKLLRPNATLNRTFRNLITGEEISILAVQCSDSRDMEGHYPPNCYPGNGWTLTGSELHNYGGGAVKATNYSFASNRVVGGSTLWVAGTFAIHGGLSAPNMKTMRVATRQGGNRYYGVGQFQVIVPGSISETRRFEITEQFIAAFAPMLEAAGISKIQPNEAGAVSYRSSNKTIERTEP